MNNEVMCMADLIIDDEYIKDIGIYIKDFSSKLEAYLDDYVSILNKIKTDAVISGDISEKLEVFIQYSTTLNGLISGVGTEINDTAGVFIEEVDEKDEYIY